MGIQILQMMFHHSQCNAFMMALNKRYLGPNIKGLVGYFLWSCGLSRSITPSLCCISKAAAFPNDFHGGILMYVNEIVYLHKYIIFILRKHLQNRCAGKK
jgi:hypothetical protein